MATKCIFCKYYHHEWYGHGVCYNKEHAKIVESKIGEPRIEAPSIDDIEDHIADKCFRLGIRGRILKFSFKWKRLWYQFKLK